MSSTRGWQFLVGAIIDTSRCPFQAYLGLSAYFGSPFERFSSFYVDFRSFDFLLRVRKRFILCPVINFKYTLLDRAAGYVAAGDYFQTVSMSDIQSTCS